MKKKMTEKDFEIERWVLKWKPFIKNFSYNLGLRHTDMDDWLQVARLVYWEVRDKFVDGAGKSLDSFILDMVKLRLIDLKRAEGNQNRHWLKDYVPIEGGTDFSDSGGGHTLELSVTEDSETVLRLIYSGYSVTELRRQLGIPSNVISRAKDEVLVQLAKGDNMKLRTFLEARARELGLVIEEGEDDLSVANRILTIGSSAKRKFRVVPASQGSGDPKQKNCAYPSCENTATEGSKFCSWQCAEKAFVEVKRMKGAKATVVTPDKKKAAYTGEESSEAVKSLPNPFGIGTAAHEVFELFREGGTREALAGKLDGVLQDKGIKCTSPVERVRRVVTDVRRLGFELKKSKGGFFALTGRRK